MSDTFSGSASRFGQAVWAITLREFRSKYGSRKLGFFWAFVEPCAYIIVLTILLGSIRSTTSPLGGHIAPFIAMGIMSYMLFNRSESTVRGSLKSNRPLLSFPRIKPIGVYAGRFIAELVTLSVVFVSMFTFFVMIGWIALPSEPHRLVYPIFLVCIYGFAAGLSNATLIALFRPWENIYSFLARLNFFTSGIFFIAESMPTELQKLLYFQPLLHFSEWIRSAWYGQFESSFLDLFFVTSVTAVLLLYALMMERVFRKRVLNSL